MKGELSRLRTGVRNLDAVINGGIPRGSLVVISGMPGSGKTILAEQICFHNASAGNRVLYFSTLTEPTTKTLRYLEPFEYFDRTLLGHGFEFVDLGVMLRARGLEATGALILEHIKKVKPAMVVIDSFKVFEDLAASKEELRKFSYEIALNLMAWETTAFLLGEYAQSDYEQNPIFSAVDGLILLSQREEDEHQRSLRVSKMRGTDHSREPHVFVITPRGLELFPPRVAIQRSPEGEGALDRCKTFIPKLDELLGPGIPWGSSLLISGVAGTGKTLLGLQFLYEGAVRGEKGVLFAFEETAERLRSTARAVGWSLDEELERGMVEIVFIPQPDIDVEAQLFMIQEKVESLNAKRVVIDSVSVFLHKVNDAEASRERIFHLATVVQNAQAVGFFCTDIPYGSARISRFGVEETVADGVILLSSSEEGFDRQRYIEIYKLRNTAHLKGRHSLTIGPGGISIFPRYGEDWSAEAPRPLQLGSRLPSGVPGLDPLIGGGLLGQSATLVSGSAGIGKTLLGLQFILEGARADEKGLFVSLEESPQQVVSTSTALGLNLQEEIDRGQVEVVYLKREQVRGGQFLTVLDDRIRRLGAKRLVLDAVTHMVTDMSPDQLRSLLYNLVVRFKALGVTSLLTLEAAALHSTELATERGLSPIADNLLLLRYSLEKSGLEPMLSVIKTRGSVHLNGSYPIAIAHGGMSLGPRFSERQVRPPPTRRAAVRGRKRSGHG